jgi:THO complex subunit 4
VPRYASKTFTGTSPKMISRFVILFTESTDSLKELFTRIGPIASVSIVYDRQDRSTGMAYVVYSDVRDARTAIQEFDGANANGQPIKLSLVPNGPSRPSRNPFDTAERPARSLFDRVDDSERRRRAGGSDDERPSRRSNVARPAPDHIDRYVPGQGGGDRRRSPRRNTDRGGRRPGQRRPKEPKDVEGHAIVGGRPRKTAEELDAEMDSYFTKQNADEGAAKGDDDIDMDI